jgi:hypothetical protein
MFLRLPVTLAALCSLAAVVVAIPGHAHGFNRIHRRNSVRKCGNEPSMEAVAEKEKAFASLLAENKASGKVTATSGNYVVPVIFNVIFAGSAPSEGNVE